MTKKPKTGYVLLPEEARRVWSPQQFLEELPQVALAMATSRFGPNAHAVLKSYILERPAVKTSFLEIGRELGITKQAAEALFKRMIRKFREVLLEDKYRMCGFRLRPEFSHPLRVLSRTLNKRLEPPFLQSDWNVLLAKTWGIRRGQLGSMEPFILEILGLRQLDFNQPTLDPIIVVASDKDKVRLKTAARSIEHILRSRYPSGLSLNELVDTVRKRPGLHSLRADKIRALVRCVKNVEGRGGIYRISDRTMKRRADHYEQILRQAGRPLHYRELARRAVRYGYRGDPTKHQSVTNILVQDSRFVPIAQSGCWGLVGWKNIETRRIKEIAFDEITKAGRPLHEDKLYALIAKRRSVKRDSIQQMLGRSSQFKRVGSKLWTICH